MESGMGARCRTCRVLVRRFRIVLEVLTLLLVVCFLFFCLCVCWWVDGLVLRVGVDVLVLVLAWNGFEVMGSLESCSFCKSRNKGVREGKQGGFALRHFLVLQERSSLPPSCSHQQPTDTSTHDSHRTLW